MPLMRNVETPRMTEVEEVSLLRMTFATDEFEPFPKFIIDPSSLQSLIDKGLVERGVSNRPAVDPVGFRLTEMGRAVLLQVRRDRSAMDRDTCSFEPFTAATRMRLP